MKKKAIVKLTVKNGDIYNTRDSIKESLNETPSYEDEFEDDFDEESNESVSAFPSEGIEIVTDGNIRENNGRFELEYVETDASDMSNEVTTLSFDKNEPGIVTMERNGVCRTAMVFEAGKRYTSVYDVSGMVLELIVRTYELDNKLTDNGGTLHLGYTIENCGSLVSRVKMTMEVKAAE